MSTDYLPQLLPYQLQSGLGNYANGVKFDEMGRMKEITLGSDLQTNLEYYQASDFQQSMQLKSSETKRLPGLSQVWKLDYTYYVGGDIHTQEDKYFYDTPGGGTTRDEYWTYAYDPIQRLSEAKMQMRNLVTGQLAQAYTVNLEYGFSQATGDLASLTDHLNPANSVSYEYGDITHKHAVTETDPAHAGGEYSYDANGNMLLRYENGIEYSQTWNVENRLGKVTWTVSSVNHEVSFTYDGDGTRVMRVVKQGEVIISQTIYIGGTYEKELVSGVVTKYYSLGGKTVAMRKDGVLTYLLSDHLGSNAMAIAANGAVTAARYLPYGQPRVLPDGGSLATDKTFTGQRAEAFGLMDFNARYYSPQLGRFISADSLVPEPGNPGGWDRYAFVLNNPVKYVDPTGHLVETALDIAFIAYDLIQINQEGWTLVNTVALVADVACAIVPFGTGGGPAVRVVLAGGDAALTYSRAAAKVPDVIRASQATEKLFQFADSSNGDSGTSSTQGHHPWPQYLLGPEKQELYNLESKLHTEYHSQLDRYLSRRFGTENYVKLFDTQEKINQLLEGLMEFNKYFDETYKTHTYEALEDVLTKEGYLPKR